MPVNQLGEIVPRTEAIPRSSSEQFLRATGGRPFSMCAHSRGPVWRPPISIRPERVQPFVAGVRLEMSVRPNTAHS
jgi:hypothetical protein